MARHAFTPLRLALLALLVAACGRSPLSTFEDGAAPRPDGGTVDGGTVDGGSCTSAADCDDGLFCNGAEACIAGACVAGAPPSCDDGVACTLDECLEGEDRCQSVPDASLCGPDEICDPTSGCAR
ncbi:MAG TPA: hypothetical protein RMI62_32220, partial [Polyangiaceae bacterium LLY-WYZ-15_(1-7)]|nr:hypothetical protein [Polyangiaceae bacterium LLY-WYZ-15_(1-7)]